jgi:hypothetical protein
MKKLNDIVKHENSREWRDDKHESQDPIERVETGSNAEFMARVRRELKAIKHFKAAYVRG